LKSESKITLLLIILILNYEFSATKDELNVGTFSQL